MAESQTHASRAFFDAPPAPRDAAIAQPPLASAPAGTSLAGETHARVAGSQRKPLAQSVDAAQVVPHVPSLRQPYFPHEVTRPSLSIAEKPSSEQRDVRARHAPPRHSNPGAQSAAIEHDVLHPLASHANGTHEVGSGAAHPPAPSQCEAAVNATPSQRAGAHASAVEAP